MPASATPHCAPSSSVPARERENWYYELRLHPQWDPLRSDARFEKMLASSRTENRAVIRASKKS